jgi:hypothetical protein
MFHVQWEDEAHGAEVNYEDYTHGKLTEIMFRQIVEDRILELAQFWLENSLDSARCSITSGTRVVFIDFKPNIVTISNGTAARSSVGIIHQTVEWIGRRILLNVSRISA